MYILEGKDQLITKITEKAQNDLHLQMTPDIVKSENIFFKFLNFVVRDFTLGFLE